MNIVDDTDGPLDPRIQIELENLNNATDDINKLEVELDEANTAFGQLLSERTTRLKELVNKLGSSCIEKARCYFEANEVAYQARLKCQQQAHLYQRANTVHDAAKETVALAESRFMSHQHEWNFDQAWQDMLNHATLKVMEAETQKSECAREHQKAAVLFHEAEKKVQQLEEKYLRSINKARPYFDLKEKFDQKLALQKEVVDCLKKAVKDAKCSYATSLRALEEISNQIHEKRRDYGPREPGVGAELSDESLNYKEELDEFKISRVNSVASSEQDLEDRIQDFEDVKDLKQRVEHFHRSIDGSESILNPWELELQASVEKLNNFSYKTCENDKIEAAKFVDNKNVKVMTYDEKTLKNSSNKLDDIYQGWQSLTQSPINSIINRSKIAFKNSISKSLSNSTVNMGAFSFGKFKNTENESIDKCVTDVDSNLNSKIKDEDQLKFESNDSTKEEESQNKLLQVCTKNEQNIPKATHSLDSTPVKVNHLSSSKSINFLNNDVSKTINNTQKDVQSDCSSSKIKELPLLSFFQKSINLKPIDKSCSMINLNEKQNLKILLDKTDLGNIQAISIEKLANARHKLVGE